MQDYAKRPTTGRSSARNLAITLILISLLSIAGLLILLPLHKKQEPPIGPLPNKVEAKAKPLTPEYAFYTELTDDK